MSIEITLLAWSIILGIIQLLLAAYARTKTYGFKWAAGPRDEEPDDELGPFADRLLRVQSNFMETFPFFAAAVLMAIMVKSDGFLSATGCQLYFWGRVLYLPLYAFGVPYIRSVVWGASLAGILMIISATLPI